MSNIKAVLFDLDGTLIDTAPDFIRIIKQLCQEHGHSCPSDEAIREQVSAGARAMVKLMFGDELTAASDTDEKLLSYRQQFLDAYEADICVDSQLFTGLDTFLQTLEHHHIAWGIVTNKPRYLAEILLNRLALMARCSVLVCPEDVTQTKPDPEPLLLASQTIGVPPEQCVYIGDHIRDIQAGKAAGMQTIIASYGYIPPEDTDLSSWDADKIVDNVEQLTVYCYQLLDIVP